MDWEIDFSQLLRAALGDTSENQGVVGRRAVVDLMEGIARQTHSDGCILWRQRPANPDQLRLMAGWFATANGNPIPLSRVDRVYRTPDGKEIPTCAFQSLDKNDSYIENDLESHFQGQQRPFFKDNGIQKMLCAPVQLGGRAEQDKPEARAWKGVLCLYRTAERADYTNAEGKRLQRTTPALAQIYRASVDAIKLALLQKTDSILQNAPHEGGEEMLNQTIEVYAEALANSFGAAECSVFLEAERGVYRCRYTTESDSSHAEHTKETTYRLRQGFSGLSLAVDECVRVRDLAQPEEDIEALKKKHGASCFATEPEPRDESEGTPPSLIVTRLEYRGKVAGFVRCWRPLQGSSYYLKEDAELLELVAGPLARHIIRFQEENEREQRIELFDKLAAGRAREPQPGEGDDVFMAGIAHASELFPKAKIITVRLANPEKTKLHIHGYGLHPTVQLEANLRQKIDQMRWPLTRKPNSYAASIMKRNDGKGYWIKDPTDLDSYPLYNPLYPGVRQVIIVPIAAERNEGDFLPYGVLDLRTLGSDEFTDYEFRAAKALGIRLGNLHHAQELERERMKSKQEEIKAKVGERLAQLDARQQQLETQRKTQLAFQDVSHQVKGPLHDLRRALESLEGKPAGGVTERDIKELLARARRAELFAKLVGLLGNFAQDKNTTISAEKTMSPVDWQKMIGPMVVDKELGIHPRRNLRIEFDADAFTRYAPVNLNADAELMAHCVMNLLDNAVKYSYPSTVIRIFAGKTQGERFFVAVTNQGIPIRPHEVSRCKEREWRSPEACKATGEGAGLGLYIVDKILGLHHGELEVKATSPTDGTTQVRLIFPA